LLVLLVFGAVGTNSALASSVLVDPPAVPHLPLNAGGLAVLAIASVLFLVAGIWTVFVAGIWTTRTRHERERERQREYALDLAINNISQGLCLFDAHAKIVLCNRSYINMYGLSPEVVKPGCTLQELLRGKRWDCSPRSPSNTPATYLTVLLRGKLRHG